MPRLGFIKSFLCVLSCAHKCLSCNMFYDLICTVMAITDMSGNTRESMMMNPITENDFHLHGSAGFLKLLVVYKTII